MFQCNQVFRPGCRVLHVSLAERSQPVVIELGDATKNVDLKDQVLVFQYRGKFHAIDHVRLSSHLTSSLPHLLIVGYNK
jgi:hypothetical protein